jgi:hypothetical protein
MKDSFIFYRSFFEAIKLLNNNQRLLLYDSISNYALDEKIIDLDDTCKAMFSLIKPQLDANHRRYLNGKKSKTKAKDKQSISKQQANVNVNVNDNNNVNESLYRKINHLSITQTDAKKLITLYGKDNLDNILDQIENYNKNKKYKNLFITAKNWLNKQKNEKRNNINTDRTFGISL